MGSWRLDDDGALLVDLGDALRAAEVPAEFLMAARGALAWRTVEEDLALAELTFDSACDAEPAGLTRSGAATRTLSFDSGTACVEIEVTSGGIVGQVSPASPGRVTMDTAHGTREEVAVDPGGYFTLSGPPSDPVRLHVRTPACTLVTSWICLA
ncbi:hypothetical protein GCM10027280_23940 [Micromonospora polyrhachis]|uniref:Uncharacterized protein n=1 Tax=Micromonospora polyrhachis TaxID=1282883 RepID=A0A7W7SWW4_9ACTN|nr:hypothetical protein [Micromonospora polyrhachis]MBB4962473.1 hypothetical protein [Micromonospora polyrhachis]